ncbi:MAG TPA: hypothetical protein VFA49_15535 [Chloroflexota bacterium]|nr:hypothetical protein [Chloroflexota bacterium]
MAAEICGANHREVAVAITPVGEPGTFQVLIDGEEVFNRKQLPSENGPVADPKLVAHMGAALRGKLLATLEAAPAAAR